MKVAMNNVVSVPILTAFPSDVYIFGRRGAEENKHEWKILLGSFLSTAVDIMLRHDGLISLSDN